MGGLRKKRHGEKDRYQSRQCFFHPVKISRYSDPAIRGIPEVDKTAGEWLYPGTNGDQF